MCEVTWHQQCRAVYREISNASRLEDIEDIVKREIGTEMLTQLEHRGYVSYRKLAGCLEGHEREVCLAADRRLRFLMKNPQYQD